MDPFPLTTRSTEVLSSAVGRAAQHGNPQVEPAHLLLALLDAGETTAGALLDAVGADAAALRAGATQAVAALPSVSGSGAGMPQLGRDAFAAMSAANDSARTLGDAYVSTEHLLIGLASGSGQVAESLGAQRATPESLAEAL